MKQLTENQLDDLSYSPEYAEYIMENCDPSEVIICDGDTLLNAMENGYLWNEFCASINVDPDNAS